MYPLNVYKQCLSSSLLVITNVVIKKQKCRELKHKTKLKKRTCKEFIKSCQLCYFCCLYHFSLSALFLVMSAAERTKLERNNCHLLKHRISEISEGIVSKEYPDQISENSNCLILHNHNRTTNHSRNFNSELKLHLLPKGYS